MGFNLSIYNEKTSRLFCFSSKRVPSILCPPPPPPAPSLLIQCGPALLTHTSGEGQTAITIRVLWEVYARLRLVCYRRPLCPSLGREEGREGGRREGKREGRDGIKGRRDTGRLGHFFDVQYLMYFRVFSIIIRLRCSTHHPNQINIKSIRTAS